MTQGPLKRVVSRALISREVGAAEIFDQPPAGMPEALFPSAPATIIGGMDNGHALSIIIQYPLTVAQPLEAYADRATRQGWALPKTMLGEGFGSRRIRMLCKDSSLLSISSGPVGDGTIIVSIAPCDGPPCEEHEGWPRSPFEVPFLKLPDGVKSDRGGGGGGGGDVTYRHQTITSEVSPTDLLPHFASQLAAAGWTLGEATSNDHDARQWVMARDRRGNPWEGALMVYRTGKLCQLVIYMAKAG